MTCLLAQHLLSLVDHAGAELLRHLLLFGQFHVLRLERASAFLCDACA